jgi:hypothetical protein
MARWATQCILGSKDLSSCRVELINAGGFKSQHVGSLDYANSGDVNIQTLNRGTKGIKFGLKFNSTLGTDLQDIFDEIDAAEATSTTYIRGQIEEGIIDVDIKISPDYSVEEWATWDKHSEGWYENVVLRFVSRGDYS